MWDCVLELAKDKTCTIIYMKGKEITKRKIKVLQVEDTYVKAYCYLRHQVRIFRKENILSAAL